MYDEKMDLKLQTSALVEDRLYNWSRINCKFDKNFMTYLLISYDLLQLPPAEILLG